MQLVCKKLTGPAYLLPCMLLLLANGHSNADPDEREVALILCQVKNVELQRLRADSANSAVLKSPPIELVWRNAKLKNSSHVFDPAKTLPPTGLLEVDLVSPVLPTQGAKAMDHKKFEEMLEEMEMLGSDSSNVPAIRRRTSRSASAGANDDNLRGIQVATQTWSEKRRKL